MSWLENTSERTKVPEKFVNPVGEYPYGGGGTARLLRHGWILLHSTLSD
jgi:hypothetical protein